MNRILITAAAVLFTAACCTRAPSPSPGVVVPAPDPLALSAAVPAPPPPTTLELSPPCVGFVVIVDGEAVYCGSGSSVSVATYAQ